METSRRIAILPDRVARSMTALRALALATALGLLAGCASPGAVEETIEGPAPVAAAAAGALVEEASCPTPETPAPPAPGEPVVALAWTNYTIDLEVMGPGGAGAGKGGDGGGIVLPRAGATHATLVATWPMQGELTVWLEDAWGTEIVSAEGSSPLVLDVPELGGQTMLRAAAWPAGPGAYAGDDVQFVMTVVYP